MIEKADAQNLTRTSEKLLIQDSDRPRYIELMFESLPGYYFLATLFLLHREESLYHRKTYLTLIVMIELLRLSTKGQVVIPKSVRDRLNLKEGDKLVAFTRRDLIVLRKIESEESILSILSQPVRERIKNLDITKEDIREAISSARTGS